ncbi:glutamine-hydrolyzing carbamoyl-phosphate synthase small subunit [Roseiconus lacunae]|uniref:Carbamoyl phosphate synthase small chain n=1 Tax=Roseiconus lacunae TaxID=2605694 RepID=A0ABT7PK18_9BACT|nr:glutamine-hydrolyzing carbamoyl-phosphate synthase small subunit [Roseiconus lacunae]MCD0459386.1 glutamine-hydrolyzing carbamoyl-phosphate synthase small subunit [Roseiconus lacunae]MDM4016829.1 glutamine-hydrolyzing carbamoyl-phosphate synthase small subunit [Roseiconus lacunae]
MSVTAKLALEDGTIFTGQGFGAEGEISGEVVFNTSMTGYQEILTDPSYRGQIVTMTYPEIGNYGVNSIDVEHEKPSLAGFIVREESRVFSNYRAEGDLAGYLKSNNIVALAGIDTRALVRRIRVHGAMRGILSTTDLNDDSLIEKARQSEGLVGRDLVREVMPKSVIKWDTELDEWTATEVSRLRGDSAQDAKGAHIVCMDFGMKWNIPRHFASRGNQVTVVPGDTSAEEILELQPDGVFLSNGPGDPEPLTYAHETIKKLVGQKPVFGICLGHQLLSLALGAKTFKLKFGHRGANQPVLDLETGKVEITTQNHGFAVEEDSLPDCLEVTHRNLNDDTVAGVRHKDAVAFGVQHHPEASSGPHDSHYLFERFQTELSQSS